MLANQDTTVGIQNFAEFSCPDWIWSSGNSKVYVLCKYAGSGVADLDALRHNHGWRLKFTLIASCF